MRVRPVVLGDHSALVPLWREIDALHATLQPGFFRATSAAGHAEGGLGRRIASRDVLELCALGGAGDALCGTALARVYDTPAEPGLVPRRRVHLQHLVVARAHRRCGAGRALMHAVAAWAAERRSQQIVLTVWQGNDAAAAFYRALGYAAVSTVMGLEL